MKNRKLNYYNIKKMKKIIMIIMIKILFKMLMRKTIKKL